MADLISGTKLQHYRYTSSILHTQGSPDELAIQHMSFRVFKIKPAENNLNIMSFLTINIVVWWQFG